MDGLGLAAGMMALASAEASTPEGRRRLAAALRATLRAVDDPAQRGVLAAVDGIAEHVTSVMEHVEFLREVMTT